MSARELIERGLTMWPHGEGGDTMAPGTVPMVGLALVPAAGIELAGRIPKADEVKQLLGIA